VHEAPDQAAYDGARTAWLEERGYRVIRFDAREFGRNFPGVVDAIRAACRARGASSEE
jgi:very-short-patch-repair endonuclease